MIFEEEDFISAEIEVVPSWKSKRLWFRSLNGSMDMVMMTVCVLILL